MKKGETNSGSFKKDQVPWNKGTKGVMKSNKTTFKKGNRIGKETRFNSNNSVGEFNYKWKGDKVGYYGLHTWVQRNKGKAQKCVWCGSNKYVQWANKSFEYKRDVSDWLPLCRKHHCEYDKNHWGLATKKFKL